MKISSERNCSHGINVITLIVYFIICVFPMAISLGQTVYFSAAANYQVAYLGNAVGPESLEISDFNNDGYPDIVTANYGDPSLSVLLGSSNGSFSTATNFNVDVRPMYIAIGDINNDSKLDLAVGYSDDYQGKKVSVLLGTGTGSFGQPTDYNAGSGSGSVRMGDFNADGNLDLAVANIFNNSNTVSILLGNGTGSLGTSTSYTVGTQPSYFAVANINPDIDNYLDLVVPNFASNNISILFGTGNGQFGNLTNFAVGNNPHSIAVGDLNGDNKPDLVIPNANGNTVSIMIGNGQGNFEICNTLSDVPSTSPTSVGLADFNNDGNLDIALGYSLGSSITVYPGNGNCTFGMPVNFTVGSGPIYLSVGDFNGDSRPDIAVANQGEQFGLYSTEHYRGRYRN